jgi:hypothetical protein
MKQYCVYSQNPNFSQVVDWIILRELKYEVHLNRTRFWVPKGPMATEFFLRWYHCTSEVIDG